VLFIVLPQANVSSTNAFPVSDVLVPPPKVIKVEKLEADPVATVIPLANVPAEDPERIKVAVLVEATTKFTLALAADPDIARLITAATLVA